MRIADASAAREMWPACDGAVDPSTPPQQADPAQTAYPTILSDDMPLGMT